MTRWLVLVAATGCNAAFGLAETEPHDAFVPTDSNAPDAARDVRLSLYATTPETIRYVDVVTEGP